MKKRYFAALALMLSLSACVGSTVKITYIGVDQEGSETNSIDFADTKVDTETDQKADGELDSAVEVTPL